MADEAYPHRPRRRRGRAISLAGTILEVASRQRRPGGPSRLRLPLRERRTSPRPAPTAGIVFIGPPAEAIRAMGSKSAAKTHHGAKRACRWSRATTARTRTPNLWRRRPSAIGYPVLIKATAGGGGKGMRVVDDAADFDAALAGAQARGRGAPSATTACCWRST